jgi:tRNA nucleotidyltransferase (CCA-adding enzyme)
VSRQTGWAHFPHEADVGLDGFGPTPAAAFEQAALAMTGAITDPVAVRPETPVEVRCEAPDTELLLVDWLNALVFEMATRRMLFGRFEVELKGNALEATAWGETVDLRRHRPAVEVKGATCTALSVARARDGRWHARCVIDV